MQVRAVPPGPSPGTQDCLAVRKLSPGGRRWGGERDRTSPLKSQVGSTSCTCSSAEDVAQQNTGEGSGLEHRGPRCPLGRGFVLLPPEFQSRGTQEQVGWRAEASIPGPMHRAHHGTHTDSCSWSGLSPLGTTEGYPLSRAQEQGPEPGSGCQTGIHEREST